MDDLDFLRTQLASVAMERDFLRSTVNRLLRVLEGGEEFREPEETRQVGLEDLLDDYSEREAFVAWLLDDVDGVDKSSKKSRK